MSDRGVRGVRTVGGLRPSRRRRTEEEWKLEEESQAFDATPTGGLTEPEQATTPVSTATVEGPVATEPYAATAPVAGGGRRPSTGIPRWLVGVLAVIAGVGIALAVVFGLWWNGLRAQNAARAAAQRTAQNFLIALTNFDSRTVNADFKRITSYSTGDFAKQATQFFGPQIRQQLEANQAQSRGQISSIYVQSANSNTASVYAVVDQTIVNRNFNAPQADELRIVLTMNKISAGWRVGEVTVLQAPTANPGSTSTPGR